MLEGTSFFVTFVLLVSYRSLLPFGSIGVLWLLTGTHPSGTPSRQDDGDDRAPTRVVVSLSGVVFSCVVHTRAWRQLYINSNTPPRLVRGLVAPVDLRDDELHVRLHLPELHSR